MCVGEPTSRAPRWHTHDGTAKRAARFASRAAPALVVTDGRVATGSVAVLPALLEAATREPRVAPWLKRINDAAALRAARRRENETLDPVLKDAEVYGLVPPRAAP